MEREEFGFDFGAEACMVELLGCWLALSGVSDTRYDCSGFSRSLWRLPLCHEANHEVERKALIVHIMLSK